MARNEFVNGFGDRRETGNVVVTPRQPFSRRSTSQRPIDRFCRKKNLALPVDVSDGALEFRPGDFRKFFRDFLIRGVLNLATRDLAPALDPQSAKMTFAIPNHERFGWRRNHARMRILFHYVLPVAAVCDRRTLKISTTLIERCYSSNSAQ